MSTNRSKDRSSLCSFPFADGRHCRTLECGGLPPLSRLKPRPSTPARKPTAITLRALCAPVSVPFVVNLFPRSQALPGEAAGKDIAYHLSGSYVSACDLSSALGRLFSRIAQGQMKPELLLHQYW